jgi:hypothetical protein
MTAPERFADSQIPLALRAPSIHDPQQTSPRRGSEKTGMRENPVFRVFVSRARRKERPPSGQSRAAKRGPRRS